MITALNSFSQSPTFEIMNGDTVNRIDGEGKKQGKWIVFGRDKPGSYCDPEQKTEEGVFKDNRKTGIWLEYYCNGNIKNKITFVGGRPDGEVSLFYMNGQLSEKGTWKNNRFIGKYKQFDSIGNLVQEKDIPLKRERESNFNPHSRPYSDHIDTAIIITDKPKTSASTMLNGKHTLYNKQKQITKDGIFKDNQFWDGKAYFYNENGVLTRTAEYKNGIYVGDNMD